MSGGVETKEEKKQPYWIQPQAEQEVADKIWREFTKYKNNRNQTFANFRERNPIQYWDDSDKIFNNYREKPAWKEDWQANISDITTHSKLMAIVAMVVANRLKPEFSPKFTRNFLARIKSQIYQNVYEWTDTVYRNGDMDDLFTILMTARRGTYVGFEGWKKTKRYEGIEACSVPLEDFYPQFINKFRIEDQDRCIWRTVAFKDDADQIFKDYKNYDKVKVRGALMPEDLTMFNVSQDVQEDRVEILRWFDKADDEFHITIDGVLITPLGSKLSTRRKDGELGFWKAVYEPFDEFFYGRSLPDLMYDNQEAIDFLFNNIFDQEILKANTPLFTSAVNQLVDDYLSPKRIYQVTDATNIFQPKIEGASQTAFAVLQELQSRQNFISTDPQNQGIAAGSRRTATEVERTAEAARKMMTIMTTLLQDALQLKARLRIGTCMQYMIGKPYAKELILDSVKLLDGQQGTRILRIVPENKLSPKNQFGYSKKLAMENIENGYKNIPTEIVEFTIDEIRNFEYVVNVKVPPTLEMSKALQKAYNDRGGQIALARPDIWNAKEVGRILSDDWGWDADRVLVGEGEGEPSPTEMAMMGMGGGGGKSPLARTPAAPKSLKEVANL